MTTWTPQRLTRLRELHALKHSAREIASMLGAGITRNAVLGKLHRMNLSLKSASQKGVVGPSYYERGYRPARTYLPEDCFTPSGLDEAMDDISRL